MKLRLIALALCLMPLVANATEEPVPIEQEPRHQLRFENKHVRFFDVELEPGYESRYHWHRSDGVFVNIFSAATIAQDLGKEPVRRGGRAIGETYFIDYEAKPKAHRVSNPDSTPYRVTDTEILGGCATADPAAEGPNQTLLIDNARVFVTRIILHPGESSELYARCGMLVSVSGGSVSLESATGREKLDLPPAGFKWRQEDRTLKLVNTGKFVFHGVDIRLK